MLMRILAVAAMVTLTVCALVWTGSLQPGKANDSLQKPRWKKLQENPIDYTPFERRRNENAQGNASPLIGVMKQGFAKVDEIGATRIVNDPTLNKALNVEVQAMVAERLGIKAPPTEIILVDDIGVQDDAFSVGQGNDAVKAALARAASSFTVASTGGGGIVLGLSALRLVKSHDELDFLLSHELSHILYDHFSEEERKQRITRALGIVILIAAIVTRRESADTREAVAWSSIGLIVGNALLGASWDREQEYESDELGMELLIERGRSADGARNVLEWYKQRDQSRKEFLDLMCGPDSAGESFLKGLLSSIIGIAIPPKGFDPYNPICEQRRNLLAALFKDHPDSEDRLKNLLKYKTKVYPDAQASQSPIGAASLMELLSPGGEMSVLGRAHEGIEAYHKGDFLKARQLSQAIPELGPNEQRIPVLELRFYVANLDGKREQALQYLDLATKVPEESRRISIMTEMEYVKDRRWGDAIRIVRRRVGRGLASPLEALPLVISYLKQSGKRTEADAVMAECIATQNPAVVAACEGALINPPTLAGAPAVDSVAGALPSTQN